MSHKLHKHSLNQKIYPREMGETKLKYKLQVLFLAALSSSRSLVVGWSVGWLVCLLVGQEGFVKK